MDFKLVSKNNIGGVIALLLVILLSQSKVFNFLLDSALGRTVLITFILAIAYTNKIMGVAVVLFIIILFNQSDIGYLEGFTKHSTNISPVAKAHKQNEKKVAFKAPIAPVPTVPVPTVPVPTVPVPTVPVPTVPVPTVPVPPIARAIEGFDIIGTENNIKRGKQSNSIPVASFMRSSTNVEPYSGFSDLYSQI